jgi:hypothetical protein
MDGSEQNQTVKWPSGTVYYGKIKGSKLHGNGTLIFANGNRYIGEFNAGKQKDKFFCLHMLNGDKKTHTLL